MDTCLSVRHESGRRVGSVATVRVVGEGGGGRGGKPGEAVGRL